MSKLTYLIRSTVHKAAHDNAVQNHWRCHTHTEIQLPYSSLVQHNAVQQGGSQGVANAIPVSVCPDGALVSEAIPLDPEAQAPVPLQVQSWAEVFGAHLHQHQILKSQFCFIKHQKEHLAATLPVCTLQAAVL